MWRDEKYDWFSSHDALSEAYIFFGIDMAGFQFLDI
jgi:hypothetical protein